MSVRLGVPSKGRLMAATFDWFADRGARLTRSGTDREYAGRVVGAPRIDLMLMAAGEIPRELATGRIALGVTGSDVVHEKIARWETRVEPLAALGFGQAELVIAVPKVWTDVADLGDLDAVAAQFRATHGFRLRIATKYHRLVRAHLRAAGVADYQLVDSQGATEGTVANQTAEAIADITSLVDSQGATEGIWVRTRPAIWRRFWGDPRGQSDRRGDRRHHFVGGDAGGEPSQGGGRSDPRQPGDAVPLKSGRSGCGRGPRSGGVSGATGSLGGTSTSLAGVRAAFHGETNG